MIIGIHGKKEHGKNLTAKLIQIAKAEVDGFDFKGASIEDRVNYYYDGYRGSDKFGMPQKWYFQERSFAYRLKQIASTLTSIPIADFEIKEVKDSYLPEIWDISLEGGIRFLKENEYYRNNRAYKRMTVRKLLQNIGDGLRSQLHPEVWINGLMSDYFASNAIMDMPYDEPKFPNWLVTDVRYPNEVKAIKDRKGIVIKIFRSGMPDNDKHPSETALDNYTDFEATIINDGSIEDLYRKVKHILETFEII